ncbi:MAG: radical SAM protein [Methyloceanibacter sp.]|uniref:radical SAM protein n=1 Tax=Methyloceanibacter sp. TaxID=1965321 RepID=UPI003D6D903E
MADIVIINPRFDISFWGLEHCMPLFGKQANLPVACLGLLAALVPDHHQVTLIDENVEDIDFGRLARADLVCLTGMSVQGRRLIEILDKVRTLRVMTAVGGPMATVEPEALEGLADVIFIGEADETWPEFLRDWERGCHQSSYKQLDKTEVERLPLPRIDLLKTDRYMFGSLQISRGCPFTCEFCDIIVTFGRKPRLKTSEQVLAELDSFREAGLNIVFVVDDNLIGNKKAIKSILREIVRWQQENAYPLTLFTEASLDLAEDEELMELMGLANFQSVFIGIETPNEDSLRETKKLQNVRPKAGTLLERVHRIQQNGIDVWCGMIVGFDHDDPSIFEIMPKFLADARISAALIGLLHAIPTTPLYDRLKREGRLNDDEDSEVYGTNVIPLGMSREELRDGFIEVMQACYGADAYFQRLDSLYMDGGFKYVVHGLPYWSQQRLAWAKRCFFNYVKFGAIAARLLALVKDKALRARYRRQLAGVVRRRWHEPHILFIYGIKVAMHYHYSELAQALSQVDEKTGAMPDAGRSFSRAKRAVEEQAAA